LVSGHEGAKPDTSSNVPAFIFHALEIVGIGHHGDDRSEVRHVRLHEELVIIRRARCGLGSRSSR
jgi:hypothetical protein